MHQTQVNNQDGVELLTHDVPITDPDADRASSIRPFHTEAAICNVGGWDWMITQSYGPFHIPARPKAYPYAILIIRTRNRPIDIGNGLENQVPVPMDALDMALDIARGLETHGVFVCGHGMRPTVDEIHKADEIMMAYYHRKVREADTEWARTHRHELIDDNARKAAIELGLSREWASAIEFKVDCPYCGVKTLPGVAKCPNGCIINIDKAVAGGILTAAAARELREARSQVETQAPAAAPARAAGKPSGRGQSGRFTQRPAKTNEDEDHL